MRGAIIALAGAIAFLAVPTLAGVPARLIEGCAEWITLAGILELLSVLGFVVVFKLVFGARMTWRQSSPAGLRALGASTVLPAGGLVGPGAGAWSAGSEEASISRLSQSTIAFILLTNAPGATVLAALGLTLWIGWPSGPHGAGLTLVPASLALAVLLCAWRTADSSGVGRSRGRQIGGRRALSRGLRMLCDGAADARALLVAANWKLLGAVGYYIFDNAVLWAAFRAYGYTPPVSVLVMGYLVGSLGSAVPTPAGLGAVEGGLIGALVLYGAPAAPAAAAVLLYRGISLSVPVLLGTPAWICRPSTGLRRPHSRPLRRHSPRASGQAPTPADPAAASID